MDIDEDGEACPDLQGNFTLANHLPGVEQSVLGATKLLKQALGQSAGLDGILFDRSLSDKIKKAQDLLEEALVEIEEENAKASKQVQDALGFLVFLVNKPEGETDGGTSEPDG
jgi:hypothetical protein